MQCGWRRPGAPRAAASSSDTGRRSPAPPNLALVALCLSDDALRRRRRSLSFAPTPALTPPHSVTGLALAAFCVGNSVHRGRIPACVSTTCDQRILLWNAAWSGASIEKCISCPPAPCGTCCWRCPVLWAKNASMWFCCPCWWRTCLVKVSHRFFTLKLHFFTHITRYVQIMKNAVQICTLPDAAIGRSLLFCAVAVGWMMIALPLMKTNLQCQPREMCLPFVRRAIVWPVNWAKWEYAVCAISGRQKGEYWPDNKLGRAELITFTDPLTCKLIIGIVCYFENPHSALFYNCASG